jgi:hypothetical protein
MGKEGEAAWIEAGFSSTESGRLRGRLDLGDGRGAVVDVALDDEIGGPQVYVDRASLHQRLPNVERSGKLCLRPSGVLIDVERPAAVVRDVLERTRSILRHKPEQADFDREFEAYWGDGETRGLLSICDANGPTREIVAARFLRSSTRLGWDDVVLADTHRAIRDWAGRLGLARPHEHAHRDAIFVRLERSFSPPGFGDALSLGDLWRTLATHSTSEDAEVLERLLSRPIRTPTTILISLPTEAGRCLVAAEIPSLPVPHGCRAHTTPLEACWRIAGERAVGRAQVERADAQFLIERVGGDLVLHRRCVAVVGCGAVGGHVAFQLAAMGIGRILLIDPDVLQAANAHRHILGLKYIGHPKVLGLRQALGEHFPHITVDVRSERVEVTLGRERDWLLGAEVVVFALGEPTAERALNAALQGSVPRVHVWLEGGGIGGHVLRCPAGAVGCFECAFERTSDQSLVDVGALGDPRTTLLRSLGGCAGTFTPFGAADASRAATEAAAVVSDALLGDLHPVRRSWRGEKLATGAVLTPRGAALQPGTRDNYNFTNSTCRICSPTL